MYFLMFAVLFVLLTAVNRAAFGNQLRITDLFNAVWCFCAGGAAQGFLGFDRPRLLISAMAMVTAAVLNGVYILLCKCDKDLMVPVEYDRRSFTSTVQFPALLLVHAACYLYSLPYLRRAIVIIAGNGFGALRATAYKTSEAMASTTAELLLFQWLVEPAFGATILIAVVSAVLGMKRSGWLLALSASDIAIYTLMFGGRGLFVRLIGYCVLSVLFLEGRRIIQFVRERWKVLALALIAFLVAAYLTTKRSVVGMNVIQNVYVYFAGAFVYLDKLLAYHPVGEYYLWGQALFGSVVSPIWMAAKIFFGVDYAAADFVITSYTSVDYAISPTIRLNAMTTMLYPFLADFGYAGLVIGPTFLGTIVMLAERNFKKKGTVSSLCIMIYAFYDLIVTVASYPFYTPSALFTVLFFLLFMTPISLKNGMLTIKTAPRAKQRTPDIEYIV